MRLLPLARYLCQQANGQANGHGDELEGLYRQAAAQLGRGDYGSGLYNLLLILQQDKRYRDGQPKDVMLGVFSLLGDNDPMTQAYRQQLALALW